MSKFLSVVSLNKLDFNWINWLYKPLVFGFQRLLKLYFKFSEYLRRENVKILELGILVASIFYIFI